MNKDDQKELKFNATWTEQLQEMVEDGKVELFIDENGKEQCRLTAKGFEWAKTLKDPDTGEPLVGSQMTFTGQTSSVEHIESNNRQWRDKHDKED